MNVTKRMFFVEARKNKKGIVKITTAIKTNKKAYLNWSDKA